MAIVGAGPVGLALALWLAQMLPHAHITLLDARPVDADLSLDPRTLALSWGSVQMLQRLGAWRAEAAEPIFDVQVSQQGRSRSLWAGTRERSVAITAREQMLPMLGAVMGYGALLEPLQNQWLQTQVGAAHRLHQRFGTRVVAIEQGSKSVEVRTLIDTDSLTAGACETNEHYDLVVMAEGRADLLKGGDRPFVPNHDAQIAWVGTVDMAGAPRGVAFERFTLNGPAALLPLSAQKNALVWCVPTDADPVRSLDGAARVALLNTIFPKQAGQIVGISALKALPIVRRAPYRPHADSRIWAIGNAAQTLHPVAGQGLNVGLRDALICAESLRWAAAHTPANQSVDWTQAARRFQRARAPDRWSLFLATNALARGFTLDGPGLWSARDLGLAALQMFSPLKAQLAHHMMFGWR
jgi:2-octaprenyl-6-methoxyphenol hydroxylase